MKTPKTRKPKTTKPKIKKEKVEGKYRLSVSIGEESFDFLTNDLVETLSAFPKRLIKSKVLFKIERGDKTFEKLILPRLARRYFTNRNFAEVFAHNVRRLID